MPTIMVGILVAVAAGVLNGSFATPMKRTGKWAWENTWIMWAVWGLIVSAWGLALATVPDLFGVYRTVPSDVILRTVLFGAAWGFGAISFGMGVHLVGLSLGFSIIVGITAVSGSLIPMLVTSPGTLMTRSGAMILFGLLVTVIGVALCGAAGVLRERDATQGEAGKSARRQFKLGFAVCIASGLLNAMLNLAFVFGAPIAEVAKTHITGAGVNFRAGNATWAMALLGSFVTNALYCGWLLIRNGTWRKFGEPGTGNCWFLTFLMGAMWMGGYALYGAGASTLGKLGATVGWIILMASTVLTGNLWGVLTGEWRGAPPKARSRMVRGLALLTVSIVLVSLSSSPGETESVMQRSTIKTVMGQPSYVLSTNEITAALTEQGGQLGPITFTVDGREIQPMSIAPWWNEKVSLDVPPVARILRGDLFCMPFGLNTKPFNGERHPVHGETTNEKWHFEDYSQTSSGTSLHVSMNTKVRAGRVDKWIMLVPGQTVVYERDRVSGMRGPMCFGHHAMLKFPDHEGAGRYSCSKWTHGQVFPEPCELPENKGYSILKPGAIFNDLSRVPTITGATTDLTRYPARRGFEDVVSLAADTTLPIAWNAVAFPDEGYAWFSLRDPKILASTMLWMSNGGRWYAPWNGRHVNVLGIEDNTAFYHYGLADAVGPNAHNAIGIKTSLELDPAKPLTVNYITGVAPITKSFDTVVDIKFDADSISLIGKDGSAVNVAVDLKFLSEQK